VRDVDAASETITRARGSIINGPFDEPDVGRFSAVQDPVGAHLHLWRSTSGHGGEVFDKPGRLAWVELCPKEPEKASAFYQTVLEVMSETIMAGPNPYTLLKINGSPMAGILPHRPKMGEGPATWEVYFSVDDVDEVAKSVTTLGGKVIADPFDLPAGASMAVLQDSQGAVFEVIKQTGES